MNQEDEKYLPEKVPIIIVQPGYATGDMFAIAATMINNKKYHVLISTTMDNNGNAKDPYDNSKAIIEFYRSSGIHQDRIHPVSVDGMRSPGQASLLKKQAISLVRPYGIPVGEITRNYYKPVGEGTQYIARNFSETMRSELRDAWDINESQDEAIKIWLETQGIPTSGKSLLILWSRFSGKGGDIHIEHDTSYWGIRQIIHRVADMYDAIIITGDKGYVKERASKYDETANLINKYYESGKVFNITEFWRGNSPELKAWGGNTRLGQFKLYDYFQRHFDHVKHLGFRSGNLEVMAMLGYKVRYMEEEGSESGSRMTIWFNKGDGETVEGGTATGYERLLLREPPTRSGKYIQYQINEINRKTNEKTRPLAEELNSLRNNGESPESLSHIKELEKRIKEINNEGEAQKKKYAGSDLAPYRKDDKLPAPISKKDKSIYSEGFSDGDMETIVEYLRPAGWVEIPMEYERRIPQNKKDYQERLNDTESSYRDERDKWMKN